MYCIHTREQSRKGEETGYKKITRHPTLFNLLYWIAYINKIYLFYIYIYILNRVGRILPSHLCKPIPGNQYCVRVKEGIILHRINTSGQTLGRWKFLDGMKRRLCILGGKMVVFILRVPHMQLDICLLTRSMSNVGGRFATGTVFPTIPSSHFLPSPPAP